MNKTIRAVCCVFLAALGIARAQSTVFTYQGRLNSSNNAATGLYDFSFNLFAANSGGVALTASNGIPAVPVTNGLFSVTLNFGSQFPGADRWLEIAVRTNGAGAFATLAPRQPLTATPYAIRAADAGNAAVAGLAASVAPGAVNNLALAIGSVDSTKIADGTITALDLNGAVLTNTFWRLTGNAGTTPGVNYIGTSDNQPVEFKANNVRAFRLEPNATSPNVLGGFSGNVISNGVAGAVIAGGGQINNINLVGGSFSTVGGGYDNAAYFGSAVVAGGDNNTAAQDRATVSGGYSNRATGLLSTVGGGDINLASGVASTVPGGSLNAATATYSFAAGRRAKANHQGAFVWADSQNADFASSAGDQFLIRAAGGVGIGVTNPVGALQVNGTIAATVFSGSGAGLTNVIAHSLDISGASTFWQLNGNAGTDPSTNFLGTTDFKGVTMRVNNQVGLRLVPSGLTPQVIGGHASNRMTLSDIYGGTIGGGGNSSNPNQVSDDYSTVAGGEGNTAGNTNGSYADASHAFVGGGLNNAAITQFASVVGGARNLSAGLASVVGGGDGNVVTNSYGTISGGVGNLAGGIGSSIGGGTNNENASDYSSIGGGAENSVPAGSYGTIAGGWKNTLGYPGFGTTAHYSAIGGGFSNTVWALYSTIGGGFSNRVNSSGVGYAVIAGGLGNVAEGNYPTVGGGAYNKVSGCTAGTIGGGLGNNTSASRATIGGGENNAINGGCDFGPLNPYCTIGGGANNLVDGSDPGKSTIAGGVSNRVTTVLGGGTIGGGTDNLVSGGFGTIPGGTKAKASNFGQMAYASGQFASAGDAQTSTYVCRGTTADATLTELFLDGAAQRMLIPANSTWTFDAFVTARSSTGNSGGYQIRGLIKNNAGTTSIVGAPTITILGEDVAAWDATVGADNANDALVVRVTGAAATSIRWVATVRTTEVIY